MASRPSRSTPPRGKLHRRRVDAGPPLQLLLGATVGDISTIGAAQVDLVDPIALSFTVESTISSAAVATLMGRRTRHRERLLPSVRMTR